jgi:hypothetical protein
MHLRTAAFIALTSLASLAAITPGKEDPPPSLIVNDSDATYNVRLSSIARIGKLEWTWAVAKFYRWKDGKVQETPEVVKDREKFVTLEPHSRMNMVLVPSKYCGYMLVWTNFSLDRVSGGPAAKDLSKVQFAHFQVNTARFHPDDFVPQVEALGIPVPVEAKDMVKQVPKEAIVIKSSDPGIVVNPDNYQKADQGPFWLIKGK